MKGLIVLAALLPLAVDAGAFVPPGHNPSLAAATSKIMQLGAEARAAGVSGAQLIKDVTLEKMGKLHPTPELRGGRSLAGDDVFEGKVWCHGTDLARLGASVVCVTAVMKKNKECVNAEQKCDALKNKQISIPVSAAFVPYTESGTIAGVGVGSAMLTIRGDKDGKFVEEYGSYSGYTMGAFAAYDESGTTPGFQPTEDGNFVQMSGEAVTSCRGNLLQKNKDTSKNCMDATTFQTLLGDKVTVNAAMDWSGAYSLCMGLKDGGDKTKWADYDVDLSSAVWPHTCSKGKAGERIWVTMIYVGPPSADPAAVAANSFKLYSATSEFDFVGSDIPVKMDPRTTVVLVETNPTNILGPNADVATVLGTTPEKVRYMVTGKAISSGWDTTPKVDGTTGNLVIEAGSPAMQTIHIPTAVTAGSVVPTEGLCTAYGACGLESNLEMSDAEIIGYHGSDDAVYFGLAGTHKLENGTQYLWYSVKQNSADAVRAASTGAVAQPTYDQKLSCDATGCNSFVYTYSAAIEELKASGKTEASIQGAFNRIEKKSPSAPPTVYNAAFSAKGTLSADEGSMTLSGEAQASGLAFAPYDIVGYCENTGTDDGFDETTDKPYVAVQFDGSHFNCPASGACTFTQNPAPLAYDKGKYLLKKAPGKAGLTPDEFVEVNVDPETNPTGFDIAGAYAHSPGVSGGTCPAESPSRTAFFISMYTTSANKNVLGKDITPFDAEILMSTNPGHITQITSLNCGAGKTKRMALVALVMSVDGAATGSITKNTGGEDGGEFSATGSVEAGTGKSRLSFKKKVGYFKDGKKKSLPLHTKLTEFKTFFQNVGMGDADAATAADAAIRDATFPPEVPDAMQASAYLGVLTASIKQVSPDDFGADKCDFLYWDPTAEQTDLSKNVAKGTKSAITVDAASPATKTGGTGGTIDGKGTAKIAGAPRLATEIAMLLLSVLAAFILA